MANTVIITGASQGIGKATALEFARQGYDIVLADRQPDRLEAAATEVRSLGREALAIPTDVRDPEQVNNLVQKALAHFGHIDVLINDAGIYYMGPVEEASLNDWQQVIDTNLWGYIHTIHALLPHFLERGTGTMGKDEETAHARSQLLDKAFHSPVLEKPEDVAQAIWKAVKLKRSDVVVGNIPASLWDERGTPKQGWSG